MTLLSNKSYLYPRIKLYKGGLFKYWIYAKHTDKGTGKCREIHSYRPFATMGEAKRAAKDPAFEFENENIKNEVVAISERIPVGYEDYEE